MEEMRLQGVTYEPVTFSAFGRVHPDAVAPITNMAKNAARRRGLGNHKLILRRAMARVGVEIWRRAASMVEACLPQPSPEEMDLLFGS